MFDPAPHGGEPMKRCPHCGSEFPSRYKFCIKDGVALIEVAGHGPGGTASPSHRTGVAPVQLGGSPQREFITPPPSGALINWLQTHKLMWISAVAFAVLAILAIMVIIARLPAGEEQISEALRKGKELRADLLWSISMVEGLPVWSVTFSPDGRFLAVGGGSEYLENGGAVTTISARDGSLVKTFSKFPGYASWVAYSPDGRFLGATTSSKGGMIWKVADGSLVGKVQEESLHLDELVSFSRDGQVAAVGWDLVGNTQAMGIFRVQDGELKVQRLIRLPRERLVSLSLSPDWNMIAGGREGSIRLWRLESDRLVLKWKVPLQACGNRGDEGECSVQRPTFSPDGRLLALPYDVVIERGDGSIFVQQNVAMIRTEDGTIVWTFTGEFHEDSPDSPGSPPVVFSPNGSFAAAAGRDGVVRNLEGNRWTTGADTGDGGRARDRILSQWRQAGRRGVEFG